MSLAYVLNDDGEASQNDRNNQNGQNTANGETGMNNQDSTSGQNGTNNQTGTNGQTGTNNQNNTSGQAGTNNQSNRPNRPVLSIINPYTQADYRMIPPSMPDYPHWHPTSVLNEYQHNRGLPHSKSNLVLARFFNATGGDVRRMPRWVREGHVARMGWLEFYRDRGFWARAGEIGMAREVRRKRWVEYIKRNVMKWVADKQKGSGKSKESEDKGEDKGEDKSGTSNEDEDEEDEEMLRFMDEVSDEDVDVVGVGTDGGTHEEDRRLWSLRDWEIETEKTMAPQLDAFELFGEFREFAIKLQAELEWEAERNREIESEKAFARQLDEAGLFGNAREIAIKKQTDLIQEAERKAEREAEQKMMNRRRRIRVLRHPKLRELRNAEPREMLDIQRHRSDL